MRVSFLSVSCVAFVGVALSANAAFLPAESRGFIGDTGSGWDTTSAVAISASDARDNPGSWKGSAIFAINGNGVVGGGTLPEHEGVDGDHWGCPPCDYSSVNDGKAAWWNDNHTGDFDDDTQWVSVTPANWGLNLHAAAATDAKVTLLFSFDQAYALNELHIYNGGGSFPPYNNTGINGGEILVSTVNSDNRADWNSVAWNTSDGAIQMTPAVIDGVTNDPSSVDEFVDLEGIEGQYVLLSVTSNHGSTWGIGAGEFRFFTDSDLPPEPPSNTEACCFTDGSCVNMIDTDCVTAVGVPQGTNTKCFLTICPQPPEGCCFGNGTCDDIDPSDCVLMGGTPQGSGILCAGANCEVPTACCLPEGGCENLLVADCAAAGGIAQGFFTDCGNTTCPQLEACCFSDETCSDILNTACDAQGGSSEGPGSTCATASCTPATPEAADNVMVIGIEDIEGRVYTLDRATSLNPDWAGVPGYIVGDGGSAELVGARDDPHAYYRYNSDASIPAESRGFIGDTGSGWDTTSAVSISASDARDNPGSWKGSAIFAINGNGVVGGGTLPGHEGVDGDHWGCPPCDYSSVNDGKAAWWNDNHTGDFDDDTQWVSVTPANWGLNLHAAAATDAKVTLLFSFDQTYPLGEMHIYNAGGSFPPYNNIGINGGEILVSTVNSDNRADWNSVAWNTSDGAIQMTPDVIDGVTNDPSSVDEVVDLEGIEGQYVLLSVTSNHGSTWGIGAGEFRFFEGQAPATTLSAIQTVSMGNPTGMAFNSVSGTLYELERALKMFGAGQPNVNDATFEGTGAFVTGDGDMQSLYDPDGWDSDTYWYRVVPKL